MAQMVTIIANLVRAFARAYERKLSFLVISVIVFVVSVTLLAKLDLLPSAPVATSTHISLTASAHNSASTTRAVIAEYPKARTIHLDDWTCPPGQGCPEDRDGVRLRNDGVHYDAESGGLDLAASWVLGQVFLP